MYHLVVRNPFGGHAKGATITDATTVAKILADPHRASCVVKLLAPVSTDASTGQVSSAASEESMP
jgi:hypothetical protein